MLNGSLYLLVQDRSRELEAAAQLKRSVRGAAGSSDEVRRRRTAAARRLLRSAVRRG
ncbi:MAG: hypothetical protein ACRENY_04115 [Candidatus Dormibacteria bacterium]